MRGNVSYSSVHPAPITTLSWPRVLDAYFLNLTDMEMQTIKSSEY